MSRLVMREDGVLVYALWCAHDGVPTRCLCAGWDIDCPNNPVLQCQHDSEAMEVLAVTALKVEFRVTATTNNHTIDAVCLEDEKPEPPLKPRKWHQSTVGWLHERNAKRRR